MRAGEGVTFPPRGGLDDLRVEYDCPDRIPFPLLGLRAVSRMLAGVTARPWRGVAYEVRFPLPEDDGVELRVVLEETLLSTTAD